MTKRHISFAVTVPAPTGGADRLFDARYRLPIEEESALRFEIAQGFLNAVSDKTPEDIPLASPIVLHLTLCEQQSAAEDARSAHSTSIEELNQAAMDALSGFAWLDDRQLIQLHSEKVSLSTRGEGSTIFVSIDYVASGGVPVSMGVADVCQN